MADPITLLVGTSKGAFLLTAADPGAPWTVDGPFCNDWGINHFTSDPATGTIWAGGGNEWEGAGVWRSDDRGETWTVTRLAHGQREAFVQDNPDMAAEFGMTSGGPVPFDGEVDNIWSLAYAHGRLYAGTKPANLLVSDDRGETWTRNSGLADHPTRDSWQPGGVGLTLHTILPHPGDPGRMWLGLSAAGMFATEDGGKSWERRNRLANTDSGAGTETGLCVHNAVCAAAPAGGTASGPQANLLYQQNHEGIFRSGDGGRSWHDISDGLPSRFGFPIASDPHDPQTLWVLPLNGDSKGRFPPDAAAKVWRSEDGGASWHGHDQGLPTRNCFFTVLRQAMTTDRNRPAGVYFGTNSGSVFGSFDGGLTWSEIARHLPTVFCVECRPAL